MVDYITERSPSFNKGAIATGKTQKVDFLDEYKRTFTEGYIILITAAPAELTIKINEGPDIILDDDVEGFAIYGFRRENPLEIAILEIKNTGTADATYRMMLN